MLSIAARLVDASFSYEGNLVLDRMAFDVPEGEFTGIIGANGSGKTTSLRLLSGVLNPAEGSVEIFGKSCDAYSRKELAQLVGTVPQNATVPFAFTVREVVAMGRFARMERFSNASMHDMSIVERSMAMTDVLDFADRTLQELSGGERQRVIIARALAAEPKLLLLDEPTSFLDINHQVEIFELLVRLNCDEGLTVLVVSHDLNLAAEYCRHLIMCKKGKVLFQGGAAEVITAPRLQQVFGCEVGVEKNSVTGAPIVQFTRQLHKQPLLHARIHVVCGGGSGASLIRRLVFRGHQVTAGVLNRGDSDEAIVVGLGVTLATEQPFAPLGPQALTQNRLLMDAADAVVLAPTCWGAGNIANLEQILKVAHTGMRVFLVQSDEAVDYTEKCKAERLLGELKKLSTTVFYSTVTATVAACDEFALQS